MLLAFRHASQCTPARSPVKSALPRRVAMHGGRDVPRSAWMGIYQQHFYLDRSRPIKVVICGSLCPKAVLFRNVRDRSAIAIGCSAQSIGILCRRPCVVPSWRIRIRPNVTFPSPSLSPRSAVACHMEENQRGRFGRRQRMGRNDGIFRGLNFCVHRPEPDD